jgi:hypothetical protein
MADNKEKAKWASDLVGLGISLSSTFGSGGSVPSYKDMGAELDVQRVERSYEDAKNSPSAPDQTSQSND